MGVVSDERRRGDESLDVASFKVFRSWIQEQLELLFDRLARVEGKVDQLHSSASEHSRRGTRLGWLWFAAGVAATTIFGVVAIAMAWPEVSAGPTPEEAIVERAATTWLGETLPEWETRTWNIEVRDKGPEQLLWMLAHERSSVREPTSDEARRAFIYGLYYVFEDRGPAGQRPVGGAEVEYWVGKFRDGWSHLEVAAEFARNVDWT